MEKNYKSELFINQLKLKEEISSKIIDLEYKLNNNDYYELNKNNIEIYTKNESCLYLIFEIDNGDKKFLYSGITKDLRRRLKNHISNNKVLSSLAKKIAIWENEELREIHQTKSTSKWNNKNLVAKYNHINNLKEHFEKKLKEDMDNIKPKLNNYYVTFIEIDNYFLLHSLEPFVSCHFKCYWNTFEPN
jgi:predicted GIY-YIG superfamily endonuclease